MSLFFCLPVLALAVVPVISVAVRQFGRYLRELSHSTQAAAAVASSIAEVSMLSFSTNLLNNGTKQPDDLILKQLRGYSIVTCVAKALTFLQPVNVIISHPLGGISS